MAREADRVFVGRTRELDELGILFASVAGGHGVLRFITGEAGIGKTRLVRRAARLAGEQGFRVAWGRCWEAGGAPAYLPWSQVFTDLGLGDPFAAPETRALDVGELRFRQFEKATRTLFDVADAAPLAIVLDDLHAADGPSLSFLQVVARSVARARVLLLGTYRDHEARLSPEIGPLLAKIAREGDVLALDRLPRGDVEAWIRQQAPETTDDDIARVHSVTEGNPFFIHELLRLRNKVDVRRLPDGLTAVLEEHLSRVPTDVRATLATASVLGREMTLADVAALSAVDLDIVHAHVRGACDAGLLEPVPEGDDRYAFSHVLVRDRLYTQLAASRRAALHFRAGERLAPADPARAAHHLLEGRAAGSVVRVAEVARRAVELAMARFAFEDAAALAARAIDALEREPAGDSKDALACELQVMRGECLIRSGDLEGGHAACVRAAAVAQRIGSASLQARAALAYAIQIASGQRDGMMARILEDSLAALEGSLDEALRARVMARLSAALTPPSPETYERGLALAREAMAIARRLVDRQTFLFVGHYTATMHYYHLAPDERRAALRQVTADAAALGESLVTMQVTPWWFAALREDGKRAEADAALDTFARLVHDFPNTGHAWRLSMLYAARALLEGDFDEADGHARDVLEHAERENAKSALVSWVGLRIALLRARGPTGEAAAETDRQVRIIAELPSMRDWGSAWLYAATGRVEEARRALRQVDVSAAGFSMGAVYGAAAAVLLGDAEQAARFHDTVGHYPPHNPVVWGAPAIGAVFGPTALVAADSAALLGRNDEARRFYEEALAVAERMGGLPFVAMARRGLEALGGGSRKASVSGGPPASVATLARAGEVWSLRFEGRTHVLRARRGFTYLAEMLVEPGRETHVLELSAGGDGSEHPVERADAVLDPKAKAAYRARLEKLREAEDAAVALGNTGAAAGARAEIEALASELARALGLGGRSRGSATAADRARAAVTLAVRRAIDAIAQVEPELGAHLHSAMKTGVFCSYRPDPQAHVAWRITR